MEQFIKNNENMYTACCVCSTSFEMGKLRQNFWILKTQCNDLIFSCVQTNS